MKPITPTEVKYKKKESIAPEMIQAVNELILKKFDGHSASVKKDDIIKHYFKLKGVDSTERLRGELYENHQLDFEAIFREAGWIVDFESPDRGESFDDYFKFKPKTKPRNVRS